jgi:AraC-like DNA-binding protein
MRAFLAPVPKSYGGVFHHRERSEDALQFVWHFHRAFELTLIRRGQGMRFVGDSTASYSDNDLILVGPGLPHSWSSDADFEGPNRCVVVHFAPEILSGLRMPALGLTKLEGLLQDAERGCSFSPDVVKCVEGFLTSMSGASALTQIAVLLKILEELSQDERRTTLSKTPFSGRLTESDVKNADRICQELREKLAQPVSLAEVAAKVAMSPSAFARFFKRATGQTFIDYLTDLRVRHACLLLSRSERSIAEVARLSGFGNLANFNRHFKRHQRQTPSDYRRTSA